MQRYKLFFTSKRDMSEKFFGMGRSGGEGIGEASAQGKSVFLIFLADCAGWGNNISRGLRRFRRLFYRRDDYRRFICCGGVDNLIVGTRYIASAAYTEASGRIGGGRDVSRPYCYLRGYSRGTRRHVRGQGRLLTAHFR